MFTKKKSTCIGCKSVLSDDCKHSVALFVIYSPPDNSLRVLSYVAVPTPLPPPPNNCRTSEQKYCLMLGLHPPTDFLSLCAEMLLFLHVFFFYVDTVVFK